MHGNFLVLSGYSKCATAPAAVLPYLSTAWSSLGSAGWYSTWYPSARFCFSNEKKKKKKNPKLFLRQKGHFFFFYSCHSKVGSFVFATFNASWLSCSSLWMTPEISAHFPSSWALPCCLSPSLPAASPLHFAVGNTLAAGSSGWGMTADCRTESDSLPEVLLLFENSWTPFPNLCF